MTDSATPPPTRGSLNLERYRARLGFWQAIWGTLISGGVAIAIPAAVDAYKARLNLQQAEQEVQLKQKEIESKIIDQHEKYISQFLDTALNQDIEIRLRFSEYFAHVSDKETMNQWKLYHNELEQRRNTIRDSINDKEQRVAVLQSLPKPTIDQQIELQRLGRELDWNNAEVGYARQDSNITIPNLPISPSSSINKPAISAENEQLFRQAVIDPDRTQDLERIVGVINANKSRYQVVEARTGVPWYFVGIFHYEETASNFSVHLVNGDPLSARTTHYPTGRPTEGNPPFSWEDSASDALKVGSLTDDPADLATIGGMLFLMEKYNGFGHHARGGRSPYVWACTNLYKGGTFSGDHVFDAKLKPNYCGAAAILRLLAQRQIVQIP